MPRLTRRPRLLLLAVLVATAGLAASLVTLPASAFTTGCGDTVVICGNWTTAGCCSTSPAQQRWTRTCWLCPQNCTPCYLSYQESKCEGGC
jgi:hypothetical protein